MPRASLVLVDGASKAKTATYEDLLRVPAQLVAEILAGELHTTARPTPRHADTSSGLGAIELDLSLLWE